MLGELYGFVRNGAFEFDCLKPLEHFEPANPVLNKQYLIGSPSYDLLDSDLNFEAIYIGNLYYIGSITVSGTIPSFLTITGTQITVN
jgi:hypothetical protein